MSNELIIAILTIIVGPWIGVLVLRLKYKQELRHAEAAAQIKLDSERARMQLDLDEANQQLEIEASRAKSETENRRDNLLADITEQFRMEISKSRDAYGVLGRRLEDATMNLSAKSEALQSVESELSALTPQLDFWKASHRELTVIHDRTVQILEKISTDFQARTAELLAMAKENATLKEIANRVEAMEKNLDRLVTADMGKDAEIKRLRDERNDALRKVEDSQQMNKSIFQEMVELRQQVTNLHDLAPKSTDQLLAVELTEPVPELTV